MSYRDDVEALFQRAHYLQAEVDRLRSALGGAAVAATPEARAQAVSTIQIVPPRAPPTPSTSGRAIWLPLVSQAPPAPDGLSDEALAMLESVRDAGTAGELGLMVARLTEVEHALMMRVLALLTDDDFSERAVHRRTEVFDQLMAELRDRLAGPG